MKGNFQVIILIIFIAAAVFGLLVFSGKIPIGSQKDKAGAGGTVVIWGTFNSPSLSALFEELNRANPVYLVKYVQKNPETFDQDLLEALASGAGPDLFFVSNDLALHYKSRIFPIPYQSFSLASFKNSFVGAGEVFLTTNGILAFPILVDPLVMYYNRSMLDTNSIVYPPKYWNEFQNLTPILTQKDDSKKISKSAIALGQFSNITHAKDIVSALFVQTGNPIIAEQDGILKASFGPSATGGNINNLASTLSFFTAFSDPLKEVYSWNKSLPNSRDFFSAGNLAFYFGYASELPLLIKKNPNLNFSVASIPQIKDASFKTTSAKVTGIAVLASSKNFNSAFSAASLMATSDFAPKFSNAVGIPPARRDYLSQKMSDAYFPIFFSSALFAKSWLDPSPKDTDNIFRGMIDSVLSNNKTARDAIEDAGSKMELLLTNFR